MMKFCILMNMNFFWPIVVIVFDQVNDRIIATDMNDASLSILNI